MRDLKGGMRPNVGVRGNRQLVTVWGDWLSRFGWDHFVTATFRHATSLDSALRHSLRWVRHLERRAQTRVCWARAPEYTTTGHVHLHVLLTGTAGLSRRTIEQSWRGGYARAGEYEPGLGAGYYLAKAISDDWCEVDVDRRLGEPTR